MSDYPAGSPRRLFLYRHLVAPHFARCSAYTNVVETIFIGREPNSAIESSAPVVIEGVFHVFPRTIIYPVQIGVLQGSATRVRAFDINAVGLSSYQGDLDPILIARCANSSFNTPSD